MIGRVYPETVEDVYSALPRLEDLDSNQRGEWFSVGETDADAAASLARQLHGVAKDADADAGEFTLLGYRDGR